MKDVKAKTAPSRARRILRRVVQVLLVAAFAGVLAGGWVYHRARAQVTEGLMDLGAQMMRFSEARTQDTPRDLLLNGQLVRFSAGTAERTTAQVLDFFEARCADVDGGLTEQVDALRRERPAEYPADRSSSPVLREDDGSGRGYVACMDFRESIGVTELAQRLDRFRDTGDVADIGDMRFVFAEEYEFEGRTRAHFVAMWTSGPFDLNRMFPEEGDVPGRDVEGIARPPQARRILSGWERGEPYTLTVYQTREDEAVLERFYRDSFARQGWSVLDAPRRARGAAPRTLVAERGERMVTVLFSTDLATGAASAAVIDAQ